MTTLSFPTLSRDGPSELTEWALESNTFIHGSIYTKQIDSIEIPFACWSFVAVWRNLGWADRSILQGWLAQLNGRAGRFYFSHPMYRDPRGTARGTGTTGAASQFATSVTLSGLTNGTTLLVGDFVEIQVTGAPLLLTATSNATVSGGALTLNFAPMARVAIPSSTAFTLSSPRGQFRLVEDKQSINVDPGPQGQGIGDFKLAAIEAF